MRKLIFDIANSASLTLIEKLKSHFYLNLKKVQYGNSTYIKKNTIIKCTDNGKIFLGSPAAPGFGSLSSGFLEGSNVDITDEMTNMIRAQQQFSGAAKIMQANSDMIEKLTR